jgi:hypothetical protein
MEKTKTTFLLWRLSLDYKMAISNHTLGDYITIKTIIENPSDISHKVIKIKISIKPNNKPNSSIISAFHFDKKKLVCTIFLLIFFSLKKIKKNYTFAKI